MLPTAGRHAPRRGRLLVAGATAALLLLPTAPVGAAVPAAQPVAPVPAASTAPAAAPGELAALVDPLIGSAGGGNTYPGAVRPFGMLSWSPTTTAGDQTSTGGGNGYSYGATRMRGLSLTHVNGAGCFPGAAGDVPIFPHVGPMTLSPSADTTDAVYASGFSHDAELAEPGRYRVGLASGAAADLAVTTRAGVGDLSFPQDQAAQVLFRTSNSLNGSEDAEIAIDAASRTVSGSVLTGGFCSRRGNGGGSNKYSYYRLYFSATFDRDFAGHGTWVDDELQPGSATARGGEGYEVGSLRAGRGSGGYVTFDTSADADVAVRVGISYTSVAAAQENLAAEIDADADVASVAREGLADWDEQLRAVEVSGGTAQERTTFYTALYHSFLQPNVTSDVAGTYPGPRGELQRLDDGQEVQYGNFSGWDQYRAHTQLLALLEPEVAGDFAQSLANLAELGGGVWDRWVHVGAPTRVMTGDPSAPTLAGFSALGVENFDVEGSFDSLVRQATEPRPEGLLDYGCPGQCSGQRPNLAAHLDLGYAPDDTCHCWGGAAETLEAAAADAALADWARQLGRDDVADVMSRRAGWWRNTFNPAATPAAGYQQARDADGSWVEPFDPATQDGFAQGSSATYTWMVRHDVAGLAELMGGREAAAARLEAFLRRADGSVQTTGGDPLRYDPTNEPGIHAPWLFNALGQPWKTQEVVRALAAQAYGPGPDGLPGNDDLGTMSAWYVFAALGMYPQTPSRGEVLLSSPVFEHATITRRGGPTITVAAPGAGPEAVYVQGVTVDGEPWTRSWLPASVLTGGGEVVVEVGATADTTWGTAPGDLPVDRVG